MAAHSDSFPTSVPYRTLRVSGALLGGLAVVGVLALVLTFVVGSEDRRWLALHQGWLYWSSIATGLVVIGVAHHITNARWAWSIRRFTQAGAAFLPVSFVLFFVQWMGNHTYFHHWIGHIEGDPVLEEKAAWLTTGGMLLRDSVAIAVLFGMLLYFVYHSLRPDLYGSNHSPLHARLTGGHRGIVGEEAKRSRAILNIVAPITALLFGLFWGMVGIDQVMTMLPHWFSTMFPVTFLVSAFHSAIAMNVLMVVVLGLGSLKLHDYITTKQLHDMGKMLFAFAVFWMYINWSQYVVIWYGLLPHEQEYFVQRFNAPFTWLTIAAVACIFVFTFLSLLPRTMKKTPAVLAGVATVVLVGHWLERLLISYPSVWTEEMGHFPIGLPELLATVGYGALFFACYLWFLKTFPALPSPASLATIPQAMVQIPAHGRRVEA